MSVDYSEVLADLTQRRDALNAAIAAVEGLAPAKPRREPRAVHVTRRETVTPKPDLAAREKPHGSLTDAIRKAICESPRTATEVADRVEQLIPGSSRNSVSAIILQRMKAGEFAKDDMLKLRIARPA